MCTSNYVIPIQVDSFDYRFPETRQNTYIAQCIVRMCYVTGSFMAFSIKLILMPASARWMACGEGKCVYGICRTYYVNYHKT